MRKQLHRPLKIFLAVAAVAGLGWVLLNQLAVRPMSTDLSSVGQGTPAVVLAFENYSPAGLEALEQLKAVRDRYEDQLLFRVADLGTPVGRELADRLGVTNGMMALVDPNGEPVLRSYVPSSTAALREMLDERLPAAGVGAG
jgi:hypothetical protein